MSCVQGNRMNNLGGANWRGSNYPGCTVHARVSDIASFIVKYKHLSLQSCLYLHNVLPLVLLLFFV